MTGRARRQQRKRARRLAWNLKLWAALDSYAGQRYEVTPSGDYIVHLDGILEHVSAALGVSL